MNFVIISPGILKRLVGQKLGDQFFSEKKFYGLPKAFVPHPCEGSDSSLANQILSPNRCKRADGRMRNTIHGKWRKSEDNFPLSFPL
jgi:hypothetical protein